jgi:hydroxyethylthiazole kinase-like uncharacterized protein yjeF
MSRAEVQVVTPSFLRTWPLEQEGTSKRARGSVLVIGGAARTPGGALLAGVASLRVGAGSLQLAVAESVAASMAVGFPEAGVIGLPQTATGSVRGTGTDRLAGAVKAADVILVGPGLDDAEHTAALMTALMSMLRPGTTLVLDAYALGVLPGLDLDDILRGRTALTPNESEASRLLGKEPDEELSEHAVSDIATRYGAVVSCRGSIAAADDRRWEISTGHRGLATAGSGDVLAGTVAGLAARGGELAQAVCWATHLHAAAGDRLATRVGPQGFLARELLDELPQVMLELTA